MELTHWYYNSNVTPLKLDKFKKKKNLKRWIFSEEDHLARVVPYSARIACKHHIVQRIAYSFCEPLFYYYCLIFKIEKGKTCYHSICVQPPMAHPQRQTTKKKKDNLQLEDEEVRHEGQDHLDQAQTQTSYSKKKNNNNNNERAF